MKDLNNIKMPYAESEQYLNQLIERATESAIRQQPKAQVRNLRSVLAAAAAIALLIAGAGITYHLHSTSAEPLMAQQTASPLDSFLDSLSDDEAELLAYYDIDDDIPEY